MNWAWHSYSTGSLGNSSNFLSCVYTKGAQQQLVWAMLLGASRGSRALPGARQALSPSGGTCCGAAAQLLLL